MELKNYKLGDLLEKVDEVNTSLQYGLDDIVGVTINKQMIPTIANLKETDLSKFTIVRPNDFIYNPRTHGKKIGLGYNNTNRCYIATWNNNTFRIKKDCNNTIIPNYLYMYFNRDVWDKEACFHSWGSSTVVLSWENFCNMEINLPDIEEQKKIVRQYKTIENRIDELIKEDDSILDIISNILKQHLYGIDNYVSINEFCKSITSGGTPSRAEYSYWNSRDIPWVKNGEVKNNIIFDTEEYISSKGLKESAAKLIKKDSVLMAMYCVSTPQLSINDIDVSTNQAVCCIETDSLSHSIFLYYYLINFGNDLTRTANGAAQQNLNLDQIKGFKIRTPDNNLLDMLNKIHNRRRIVSKEIYLLKKTLTLITQINN